MKSIATDNYDFKTLIENGYAYVDKTDMLWKLANGRNGTLFFISRPRRFGKSLMLSTLKYLFEGKKKLFRGLKIAKKKWDWSQTYPIIDLNMSDFDKEGTREGFRRSLSSSLRRRLDEAGIQYDHGADPGDLFDRLIKGLAAANEGDRRVVVLVDEYDHPLGGLLDDRRALRAMRREMHGFYSTLKNNVGVIRFMMMTGVSKFTKLSVFSGLNNLQDITIASPEYAALLGYTHREMKEYFQRHIAVTARKMKCDWNAAFKSLLFWYDSYRFSPFSTVRVLNPVAVGKAIPSGILINYWSKTGMPTLILERLQACDKRPDNIDGVTATLEDLDVCDAEDLPWVSLLYQSGYLTIKDVEWYHPANDVAKHPRMTLGVPNMEVRESLKSLWWKQLMKIEERDFTALVDVAKRQLAEGDVRMLVGKTLYSLYAALPPTWRVKNEADAKRHFHLFMKMLGANVQAEEASAFGYADAIVETRNGVYVFEFKFNKSAKAAIRQIREKGYADAYKDGKRPVTLIGINFSAKKRNIDEPLIESL